MNTSEKSLLHAWAVLMSLSLALALATETAPPHRFLLAWTAFICIVAYWKARVVLSTYLGLRAAPSALAAFAFAIAVILAVVLGSFALQSLIATLA